MTEKPHQEKRLLYALHLFAWLLSNLCRHLCLLSLQLRSEILDTFRRLLIGLGPSSASAHKDIYKCVRSGLGDKSMSVRSAAARVCTHLTVCPFTYVGANGLGDKSVTVWNGAARVCTLVCMYLSVCLAIFLSCFLD